MKTYELLFALDGALSEEARDATIEKIKSMIEKEKGKIQTVDKWGMKKFAYPVKYKTEGFYCLMTFEAEVGVPKVLDGLLNITDEVVRHMIVQK